MKGSASEHSTIEVFWREKHVFDNDLVMKAPMNHFWIPYTELFAGEETSISISRCAEASTFAQKQARL